VGVGVNAPSDGVICLRPAALFLDVGSSKAAYAGSELLRGPLRFVFLLQDFEV
jgi:hypothetical protein